MRGLCYNSHMSSNQIIIDVREPFEFNTGHVEGALNITPSELLVGSDQLKEVPRDAKMIVYCRSGNRSNSSIQILKQLGFTNLVNGIHAGHVVKNHIS